MAKLIVTLDGQVLKEHEINKERMTIGRKPHNDIQIDNLAVSGEHAMIMTILNDSFLEDLGSTNGTAVNGQPIKKHFLQNNDVIEIGKYRIKYVNDQPAKMTRQEFEKTMVLRTPSGGAGIKSRSATDTQTNLQPPSAEDIPAAPPAAPPAAQPAMAAGAAAAPGPASSAAAAPSAGQGTIQILSGPNAGKELPLTKALTTVGKPGVQVAVIAKRPQGFFITHVEGATFPVVNGKALDAQAHLLNDHDVIELAGVKMEFFFKP
ncbi:MAG TPA: FHA domain-containing protein [Burkholderiales bacterium]|jgi:pSer/pThr/pTyr-binding forkhead associated (FHA) protein|nr:FHA domain-containing protein [Burkholderiales bacterium]